MDVQGYPFITALALSLAVHGVLLGLSTGNSRPDFDASNAALVVRLQPALPPAAPPKRDEPKPLPKPMPSKANPPVVGVAKQSYPQVVAAQPVSTTAAAQADAPVASPLQDAAPRPLDLSPDAISQATRNSTSRGSAPRAIDQVRATLPPPASPLAEGIAAGAVPDCLHASEDAQGNLQVLPGGLLAIPFVAYSAITGKCK